MIKSLAHSRVDKMGALRTHGWSTRTRGSGRHPCLSVLFFRSDQQTLWPLPSQVTRGPGQPSIPDRLPPAPSPQLRSFHLDAGTPRSRHLWAGGSVSERRQGPVWHHPSTQPSCSRWTGVAHGELRPSWTWPAASRWAKGRKQVIRNL